MPVTFLNPGVLVGLVAAAVPVLIHILSRRRVRRRRFSDLRFLEEAQASRARSLDLRRLLLLLLRVLIVLLVVLGAARPRVGGLLAGPAGPRSLLLLLDGSASMQAQQEDGTRFAAAVEQAAALIASLPAGSEVQVVRSGARTAPLFAGWVPASEAAAQALDALAPDDGGFRPAEALRAAAGWVGTARAAPVEVVLLSDLQGWRGEAPAPRDSAGSEGLAAAAVELAAAGPVRVLVRGVGEPFPNGGVLGVRLPLRALRAGEPVTILAEVRQREAGLPFRLELDGRTVAEAVPAGTAPGRGLAEFALSVPAAGAHRGRVLGPGDRLPADDRRPFVLEVRDRIAVLLVHGPDRGPAGRGAAGRGGWRYLVEALVPGGQEDLFAVRTVASDRLVAGDLVAADVALFVDPDPLGRQLLADLQDWLRGGGAAGFLVGDPTLGPYLEDSLLPALGLPGGAVFRARPEAAAETATLLAPDHPVFAGLGERPLRTLQEIRWRRFYAVQEGRARALLEFAGGAPALLEGRLGAGTWVLLPFDLSLEASDLALSPMALPLLQRLSAYLEGQRRAGGPGGLTVGERPLLRLRRVPEALEGPAAGPVVAGPGGEPPRPAELVWRGGVPSLLGPTTDRRGFYAFLAGGDTLGLVAAAVPAAESDPEPGRPGALVAGLRGAGLAAAPLGGEAPVTAAVATAGREIGGWLLAAAFLLLCLELFLGRGSGRRGTGA